MKHTNKIMACMMAIALLFTQQGATTLAANAPSATKSITATVGSKKKIVVKGSFIKSKSFKSTNTKIASVNKKGMVKAVSKGTCKIKITVSYRKSQKAKKVYKAKLTTSVTVKSADAKPEVTPSTEEQEGNYNQADVKALKKIIAEQKELAAAAGSTVDISENMADYHYKWDKETGRLVGITWLEIGLRGNLSISGLTALKTLYCSDNQLTGLDISGNTALTDLECFSNQITRLDVSNNVTLKSLDCSRNKLANLDVSNNTTLESLGCSNNQLTSLDISNNTALINLGCSDNPLTSLDVSYNTALIGLDCSRSQLTNLDVSNNNALTTLLCYGNQLTGLDVSNNTALQTLYCNNNQLTSLNVSNDTALETLICSGNRLASLDISDNTALQSLHCYDNPLTSLDFSNNTHLELAYIDIDTVTVTGKPEGCGIYSGDDA